MTRNHTTTLLLCLCVCVIFCAASWAFRVRAGTITATVKIGLCGDEVVDTGEQCDGIALDGASCSTQGFGGGTLSCDPACDFDTSACTEAEPESQENQSGGGGGNTLPPQVSSASVAFSGVAYSGSTVTLLKDAQVAGTTTAGNDGNFYINSDGLGGGTYLFSIYSNGVYGLKSPLYTVPVSIASNQQELKEDIYLAPTIAVDKAEVVQGEEVVIFGTSAPGSDITLVFGDGESEISKRNDLDGSYIRTVDTAHFAKGNHSVRAYYVLNGKKSPVSKVVSFYVGDKTVPANLVPGARVPGDLNRDRAVNLVDFSIMAYWYRRATPPAAVDLNHDGLVNLIDVSILAFHWTG